MSRTEVVKGNVCVGFFGDNAKEIQMLGEFMIGKKIIERTVKYDTFWLCNAGRRQESKR